MAWHSVSAHDIFLQVTYFKALEASTPQHITCYYIGVFVDENLVGIALVQHVKLYLKDMFRKTNVSFIKSQLQASISKLLKGNILVVGNLMHTGQHGMYYEANSISYTNYINSIFNALDALKTRIRENHNKTIRIVMFKDFFTSDTVYNNKILFSSKKLHRVFVQPNMVMPVKKTWLSIDDYTSSLTKKYRARYKRANKKLGAIVCRELNLEAVKSNASVLFSLYSNVSKNAKFNTFTLTQNHFYQLKLELKYNFKVFGYYLNNELIGFYTLILNGNVLETYFLGYDTKHQQPNQLYLNMLYSMVNFAIDNKFKAIIYARTAIEIKSSVGAKPEAMSIYLKHTNAFANMLLNQVFKFMNPSQDWKERHPFKD